MRVTLRRERGSVIFMEQTWKMRERALNEVVMRHLKGAITTKGHTLGSAEDQIGIARGALSQWFTGARMMSAPRFVEICTKLQIKPGPVMASAVEEMREIGLLSDVQVLAGDRGDYGLANREDDDDVDARAQQIDP